MQTWKLGLHVSRRELLQLVGRQHARRPHDVLARYLRQNKNTAGCDVQLVLHNGYGETSPPSQKICNGYMWLSAQMLTRMPMPVRYQLEQRPDHTTYRMERMMAPHQSDQECSMTHLAGE